MTEKVRLSKISNSNILWESVHFNINMHCELFRSAKMQMMLIDAEEQLKSTWKRHWRKAISGDIEWRRGGGVYRDLGSLDMCRI